MGEGRTRQGLFFIHVMGILSHLRFLRQIDWQSVEFCFPTIIQSQNTGTGYDLRYQAESTQDNIAHKGVFLISVGLRYKGYCVALGRSFIVDPSKVRSIYTDACTHLNLFQEQEAIYQLLLELQTELLDKLQDGVAARDVYQHAISRIKEKKPELEKNFVKNVGFGVSRSSLVTIQLFNP